MEENWKTRLLKAVDEDPRSDRAISLATNMGVNTVNELRNTDKSPSIDKVLKLSEVLNLDLGYLFWGQTPEKETAPIRGDQAILEMLKRIEGLDQRGVEVVFSVIDTVIKRQPSTQEQSSADDQRVPANLHHEPKP
ncbi:helix-turn-helix transcriptional regulator [Brucella intermedia]|uniref:helix-turn-helix transcriptional regulator n=1 Tax=Brucella intermedia TaxID=94625 RepID=UPI00235E443C|nr:helix-turn-helix transcriptional regulator [Brucella intermedia]